MCKFSLVFTWQFLEQFRRHLAVENEVAAEEFDAWPKLSVKQCDGSESKFRTYA